MDRWLENLQKGIATTPLSHPAATMEPNVPLEFRDLAAFETGLAVGGAPPDPVGNFFEKAAFDLLLKSPGVNDESWDAPFTKTTADRSTERFAKASAAIEHFFADHPEECAEAIAIARKMVADERAAVLAEAAA